jgi:hypothetical protein
MNIGQPIHIHNLNNMYQDEYGEEQQEENEVIRAEEVKEIINSIPVFKYEEKKKQSKKDEHDSCAICLDDLQTGQMVKALACSHKFHEKCINNWLK